MKENTLDEDTFIYKFVGECFFSKPLGEGRPDKVILSISPNVIYEEHFSSYTRDKNETQAGNLSTSPYLISCWSLLSDDDLNSIDSIEKISQSFNLKHSPRFIIKMRAGKGSTTFLGAIKPLFLNS